MSLLHKVLENGKVKKCFRQQKDGKALPKMRKVQLGWLHFDDQKQSFVSVRMANGGGTREVDIKLNADKDDIIDIAKTIFFTDGNSNFGPEQLMVFGLANFQHESPPSATTSGVGVPPAATPQGLGHWRAICPATPHRRHLSLPGQTAARCPSSLQRWQIRGCPRYHKRHR